MSKEKELDEELLAFAIGLGANGDEFLRPSIVSRAGGREPRRPGGEFLRPSIVSSALPSEPPRAVRDLPRASEAGATEVVYGSGPEAETSMPSLPRAERELAPYEPRSVEMEGLGEGLGPPIGRMGRWRGGGGGWGGWRGGGFRRHAPWRWRRRGFPIYIEEPVAYPVYFQAPVADCPAGYFLYIQNRAGKLLQGPLDRKYRDGDGNLVPLAEGLSYACLTAVQARLRLGLAGADDTLGQTNVELVAAPRMGPVWPVGKPTMSPYAMAARRAGKPAAKWLPGPLMRAEPPVQSAGGTLEKILKEQAGPSVGPMQKPRYYWGTIIVDYDVSLAGTGLAIIIIDTFQTKQAGPGWVTFSGASHYLKQASTLFKVAWASPFTDPKTNKPYDWFPAQFLMDVVPVSQADLKSRGLAGVGVGQTNVEAPVQRRLSPYAMAGMRAKTGLRGFKLGFGAAGASAFTMKAAQALDEHLVTNNCAGCDQLDSSLRQLTFAFKAACLTDAAVASQVALNMSSTLAMTGFGPGTDKALSLVLGASRSYEGTNCTDEQGNCLGNFVTPKIPGPVVDAANNAVKQIRDLIGQAKLAPQEEIMIQLQTIMAKALALIAAAIPKAGGATVAITSAAEKKPFPTAQVVIGGLIGVAVVGSITALVLSTRKAGG